jgi:hypothetical protein
MERLIDSLVAGADDEGRGRATDFTKRAEGDDGRD